MEVHRRSVSEYGQLTILAHQQPNNKTLTHGRPERTFSIASKPPVPLQRQVFLNGNAGRYV
ncbi:hypothetical protein E2C01_025623 [Portunus trituberculatus]|uniref:Uncharacterized protein n=1 Tax=Portunus trituberculatus TaxID=210409 RepID=A0A5B7EGY4_PORTR|nr:hypothetical protein [Portunus trituberculatus]